MAKVWHIWAVIEEYDEETGESEDVNEEQKIATCNSQEEAEQYLLLMEQTTCQ